MIIKIKFLGIHIEFNGKEKKAPIKPRLMLFLLNSNKFYPIALK